MSASVSPSVLASVSATTFHAKNFPRKFLFTYSPIYHFHSNYHPFLLRVKNDSSKTELSAEPNTERSEADKIVDGMDFGELCNEFECISSPLAESAARQLARDFLELREGNRALGTFAVSVKYKDPLRKFTGREKYKRQLWATGALDNPSVNGNWLNVSKRLILVARVWGQTLLENPDEQEAISQTIPALLKQ